MHVSHIILRVADMDRALEFYRDAVGLEVVSSSPAFSFLGAGTIRIALNAIPDGDAAAANSLTEIVMESDDVVTAFGAMESRGVPFEVPLRTVMENAGRSLVAAHFRDPDGHLVSLTGWVDPAE